MIKITPDKPRVVRNLESIEEPILRIERRMTACVEDLNAAYRKMWSYSDEEIEEIMNHLGPQEMEALLTAHATHATMFNQILASRGITSPQAIVGLPRQFAIDEAGVMHLVPLTPPVVELTPEPPVEEQPTPEQP